MGDFNFDLFSIKDDARVTEYYTTMVGTGLFPLILRPTRVSHANAALIDHIWSNFADKNVASGVVQCDLSDHYALFANFPSNSVSKNGKKKFRRRHTTDAHASFRAELSAVELFV